jgi:hypothetical protein
MIIFSSDSSDISKSFSFSSSILTGLSFVGSTSTPDLLVGLYRMKWIYLPKSPAVVAHMQAA